MLIDKSDNHFVIQPERFGRSPVARLAHIRDIGGLPTLL
jgi:hypothetical protein